ncbi:hypothetical protein F441_23115 [Phytophthora nicotianae CJ01A1]|uniref:Myb/SANT-like domain-containing protein n=1 Tax=Phytophthora nicotianae CJ01A1 TaxID=1317063 RepID=W2VP74_PHYNI|nr:hypothetical protein F441_23115 [Phytophthora nicotianae CJ01A1]
MDAHGSDLPSIHQRPYFDGIVQLPVLPSHLARESLAAMPSSTCWTQPPRPSPTPDSAPISTEWAQTTPVSTTTANPSTTVNGKRKAGAKSSAGQQGKKKKSSKKETTPSKRFVWTNKMIEALLDMRFKDDDVRLRVEKADTNRKKALAWQFFANRLSEKLEVVLTSDQCEYRQGKEARTDTGNDGNEDESKLWGILNSAFAGRTGIGGATLADADNDSDCVEEEKSFSSSNSRQKAATPIASLAAAMKDGMTAIAASMGTDDKLVEVLHDLRAAQEAARDLQARQLTLLEHLVSKMAPPN